MTYIQREDLSIDAKLCEFVEREALVGLELSSELVWRGLSKLVAKFSSENQRLLDKRGELNQQIQAWQSESPAAAQSGEAQLAFLRSIGYVVSEPPRFQISTEQVDPEIAFVSGPQLVVPASNARYAINAANARWGSLYDALYGTDAVLPSIGPGPYDRTR
ncbi:MAG: malate synthase G, partial [Pseudomonadota bacterium]